MIHWANSHLLGLDLGIGLKTQIFCWMIICEHIVIKHPTEGFDGFSYDEFDKLKENGLRGARAGRRLREANK